MRDTHLRWAIWAGTSLSLVTMGSLVMAKPGNGSGGGGAGSGTATPYLSFAAEPTEVTVGDTVRLSWASANARHCFASGDWSGRLDTAGFYVTPPMDGPKAYTLECKDGGASVVATVNVSVVAPDPTPTPDPSPVLEFAAADALVASGGFTELSWTASNADACSASGGWNGDVGVTGSRSVGPLDADTAFSLTCTGPGGSASSSASVSVAAQPTVTLTAADDVVASGGSTALNWISENADTCSASGGWSGGRSTSGAETVGPIDAATTFGLSCSGVGGSATTLISVAVNGTVTLSWQAPTENVDGTAISDLAGFRIYFGPMSGSYTDQLDVSSPGTSTQSLTLPSGSYYFAMTAVDADGNESGYSNEVVRTVY